LFSFALFGTVKDQKIILRKMIFPIREENDFQFEKSKKSIFFLQLFDNKIRQNLDIKSDFNYLGRNLAIR